MIIAPIIVDGSVCGSILATNRLAISEEHNGPRGPALMPLGKGFDIPFGSEDEILMGFIATNAGLALKYSRSPKGGSHSSEIFSSHRETKFATTLPDTNSAMQQLVDTACIDLDADLISVFAYNDSTKRLECTVSKDIKGLSIPIDRGIAGTSFRMGRVINVKEIASDERHNNDVDAQVGYKTQTLLCAPIMDISGRPVGVMQALNKKGTTHFTRQDEAMICDFSSQVSVLLQDADYLRDCTDNCDAVLVGRFLSALSLSKSITDLVAESRRLVSGAVDCDFVGLYTYVPCNGMLGAYLMSEDPAVSRVMESAYGNEGKILMKDLPSQIVDALRTGVTKELSVSKGNKLSCKLSNKNAHENFLPGISARHALILPIDNKIATDTYTLCRDDVDDNFERPMLSSSILVVIKSSQTLLPFSTAAKEVLELFVAVLATSLKNFLEVQEREAAITAMESSLQLANSTLGTLADYILVLSSSGNVLSSNRNLAPLLGSEVVLESGKSPHNGQGRLHRNGSINGNGNWICNGSGEGGGSQPQHYSHWFKRCGCAALVADIGHAVRSMGSTAVSTVGSGLILSSEHSEGIPIEYELTSSDVDTSRELIELSLVLVIRTLQRSDGQQSSSTRSTNRSRNSSMTNTNTSSQVTKLDNQIVDESILTESSSKYPEFVRDIVNTATGILKSVCEKQAVPPHIQKSIGEATDILDQIVLEDPSSEDIEVSSSSRREGINERILTLVDHSVAAPHDLFSWDFDVLQIRDKNGLINSLGRLIESLNLLDALGINPNTMASYITDIAGKYHDKNPFHNLHHATYVTQFTCMLIHATNASQHLSTRQLFSVILSAVVHDVDHPGNTNMFEINSQSNLALLYNDQSVLENHHCSTAFQLMRKPASNIFGELDKSASSELRRTIVSCVMATDMSVHFELVEETKKIFASGDLSFTDSQDQMFLCKLLVHSSDLSNPVRPFHITQSWARRISAEFNLQVAKEQSLGMPVLNFMITPDDKALCKNETGFASFVVAPMWRSLSSLFPGLQPLVKQLDSNLLSWKAILEKILKEEEISKTPSGKY